MRKSYLSHIYALPILALIASCPVHAETFDSSDADADSVGNPIDFTSGGGSSSNCSTRGDCPTTSSSTSQNSFSLTIGDKSIMKQDYSCNTQGEILFENDGEWTVPECVSSISVVAIGGGGGGSGSMSFDLNDPSKLNFFENIGGNGGDLIWANNIPVSPGQKINVTIGRGGEWDGNVKIVTYTNIPGFNGTYKIFSVDGQTNLPSSYTSAINTFNSDSPIQERLEAIKPYAVTQNAGPTVPMCHAYYAGGRVGGTTIVNLDGTLLLSAEGGLGFGIQSTGLGYGHVKETRFPLSSSGYTWGFGNGGQGSNTDFVQAARNLQGSGGGASGYTRYGPYNIGSFPGAADNPTPISTHIGQYSHEGLSGGGGGGANGTGGGGVGVYGMGAFGAYPSGGGSGGEDASGVNGGKYGGGGAAKFINAQTTPLIGKGGDGAVRIIWGVGRSFPNNAGYITP